MFPHTQDSVIDGQLSQMSPLFDCMSPSLHSGMLPEAVLPPSKEHSYAQWLERTYQLEESRGPPAGRSDPLLSSLTTKQSGATRSLPLHSHGMGTAVVCSVSCIYRNVILARTFGQTVTVDLTLS